ncbi:putative rRNA methyltransferase 3, mitochondrial [Apostichopus japonicus]|uniref:Putative rRNA methyltransferase 3, mitochondrial n=1 Tax=Stichopus japonicus TaxID=307972 RepID=A0A2G8L9L8_STIJA|nr:putative rRNA methyltransferase 3, mitochondrial [Apostichopus japonicus]
MAACINSSVHVCRSILLLQTTLKLRKTLFSGVQLSQIHSSTSVCGRRPLRRKALKVFLADNSNTGTASQTPTGSNSLTRPETRPRFGFPNDRPAKVDQTSTAITSSHVSDTSFVEPLQHQNDHQYNRKINYHGNHTETGSRVLEEDDSKFLYTKAPSTDKRFGSIMTMAKNRKLRERNNKVILEGKRLVHDALSVGAKCHTLFFSLTSNLNGLPIDKMETELVKIPYKEFKIWSGLSTPQGIVGVFTKPSYDMIKTDVSDPCIPLTLVCDNIRDPGNLGTILRAAAAANCEKILVTRGCVDIWDPKVLRAGAGAHFHTPVTNRIAWPEVPNYLDADTSLYIADTFNQTDGREDALPQLLHSDMDWTMQSALVIGGETEGISQEALELCASTHGTTVFIPMSKAVDSLNSAMSASILLFEAKRQWLAHQKNK